MPKGKPSQHAEILEYALSHLEQERDTIQARIDHIRRELGGRRTAPARAAAVSAASSAEPETEAAPRKTRVLSEAARKRIAAAQKRRWAEHRKKQKAE
ncbi:MAG: hypothetical protein ABUS51_06090 [Acidobacteriota bacterium]